MRTMQAFAGVIALLANSPAAVGLSVVSSSLKSNFSLTTLRPSASPTPTGSFCCEIFPMGVGLNFWANETATAYTATVITRYIEYNNTVSTELATVTNVNATTGGNIPTDLIGSWNEYGRTSIVAETVASYETTVIASPTPHLAYNRLIYLTGTKGTNTTGVPTCIIDEAPTNSVLLPTTYVYVETPPITRTDGAFLPAAPSDIIQSAVSQIPTIVEEVPFFTDCEIAGGTGQPTVHIPVTALTSHSSTTIRRGGNAPVTTGTSANGPPPITASEAVPAPTTTSSEAPGPTATGTPEFPPSDTTIVDPIAPGSSATAGEPSESTTPTTQTSRNANPTSAADASPSKVAVPSLPGSNQPPVGPSVLPPIPTGVVIPSAPGNTQPPAQSPSPTSVLTDDVLPPTASLTPSNEPGLPFPIVPVPVPTGTNAGSSPDSTANPGAIILPGDQTLNPGQETTISGVVISVPSSQPSYPAASPSVVVVDGFTTTIVASNTPVIIINGHTTTAMAATAPVVVIDGTTRTVPVSTPTSTQAAAVVPITLGSQVVNVQAATASGQAVVLPNSETLAIGATTTYADKTLVASIVTSGTAVVTVVEVLDENQSAAHTVTLPSAAAPTGAASESETGSASKTLDEEPPDYTGGAGSLCYERCAWMLGGAAGVVLLVLA